MCCVARDTVLIVIGVSFVVLFFIICFVVYVYRSLSYVHCTPSFKKVLTFSYFE